MHRYTLLQRLLHWLIALMVVGTLTIGMIFMFLEFEGTKATFGMEVTNLLYKYHKTFGILILAFMLVRLGVRIRNGKPAHAGPLTPFERKASTAVHHSLYGLLILQPLLGWSATAAGDFPIQFFDWNLPGIVPTDKPLSAVLYEVHGVVGWLILILAVIHIAAALRHWLVKRDHVMARMSLP